MNGQQQNAVGEAGVFDFLPGAEQRQRVLLHIAEIIVDAANIVLFQLIGQKRPDFRNGQHLLEHTDDDQIAKVRAVIALFDRRRQHLELDIVVDHGRGQPLRLGIAKIDAQAVVDHRHHLVHIELQRGQLVVARDAVGVNLLCPGLQPFLRMGHAKDSSLQCTVLKISITQS